MTLEQELDLRYERGYDVGVEEGITQGDRHARIETARNYLTMGLTAEQVATGSNLPLEEVLKIQNGL